MTPVVWVREAVREASLAELRALKPGNVHAFAEGHGMTLADFEVSAAVTADALTIPGQGVGGRILRAIEATRAAVGCNTNLGIVLLCAPLVHAALEGSRSTPLGTRLPAVLQSLTVKDAVLAYRAIRLAAPGGLGTSPRHDVRAEPRVTLLEAMVAAQRRDRIARQYASGFADIFGLGLARLRRARRRGLSPAWATTSVYLGFLGRFDDSHVRRKAGRRAAAELRARAALLDRRLRQGEPPECLVADLLAFDRELKQRGLNPGTSADLTVATLLAAALSHATTASAGVDPLP